MDEKWDGAGALGFGRHTTAPPPANTHPGTLNNFPILSRDIPVKPLPPFQRNLVIISMAQGSFSMDSSVLLFSELRFCHKHLAFWFVRLQDLFALLASPNYSALLNLRNLARLNALLHRFTIWPFWGFLYLYPTSYFRLEWTRYHPLWKVYSIDSAVFSVLWTA